MCGRHSVQKILSGRALEWRSHCQQRHFTGLLKEEHDLNTVISGQKGEGCEEKELVPENKVELGLEEGWEGCGAVAG